MPVALLKSRFTQPANVSANDANGSDVVAFSPRLQAAAQAAAGDTLRSAGQLAFACDCYDNAIRLWPADQRPRRQLIDVALMAGFTDRAIKELHELVAVESQDCEAHEKLAHWYIRSGEAKPALKHAQAAYEASGRAPGPTCTYTIALEAFGDPNCAWNVAQPLLVQGRFTVPLGIVYSKLAPRFGHCGQALRVLELLLASISDQSDRIAMHFAAAQLLDGIGRYDDAFAHLQLAKQLKGGIYDPKLHSDWVDAQIHYFTSERFAKLPRASARDSRPVFIVGMPRSGTSLVEQILATHPEVHGAGELNDLDRAVSAAPKALGVNVAFPQCLDALTEKKANELGAIYLNAISALAPSAARITDKLPLNFLVLGAIPLLFPGARIIHCRRDPMDTCLSCYSTHFVEGHQFTSSLESLGQFYRQYERLMAHWKSVLEVPILDVHYDQLVQEPAEQSRRLVEFLDLPWDERCLQFHENKRFTKTASYAQVRKPIYRTSVERWRRYETHLEPLKTALGV